MSQQDQSKILSHGKELIYKQINFKSNLIHHAVTLIYKNETLLIECILPFTTLSPLSEYL